MGATTPGMEAITPGVGATTPEPTHIAPTRAPIAKQARPDPSRNIDRPAPDGPISPTGSPDFEVAPSAPRRPETLDAPATRHTDPGPSVHETVDPVAAARPIKATQTNERPAAPAPESQLRVPRLDPLATRLPERETRLHIGAIEIRVARPPTPATTPPTPIVVQAPPAASAPLARAYASRFGLAQS